MSKGNPQLEDGYTKIANELLEALAGANLNGSELKTVLAILRLTYGYRLKSAKITKPQLAKLTGSSERRIARALSDLADRKIIFRDRSETYINKRYKEWKHVKNDSVKKNMSKMTCLGMSKMTCLTVKNDTFSFHYNKENFKENKKKAADAANSDFSLPSGVELYEEDYNKTLPF